MCPEIESTAVVSSDPVASTASEAMPAAPASEPVVENTPKVPELSIGEKIAAKAAKLAAERTSKGAKNTQKAAEKPALEAVSPPSLGEPKEPRIDPKEAKEGGIAPVVEAVFTPNFKLNIQKQDFEIPEILKPLMKDAESEKQIREICEKAFGLEFAKPRHEAVRQQNEVLTGENSTIKQQIHEVRQLYARGDFDGFFKRLNIPEEKVLQWMADKINYNQLPPEQKQILDARRQAEDRAYQAESYAGSMQSQHEQILTQQVQMALESTLARADVKTVADAFDARMGKPGAFKEEVNRRGDYAWKTRKELVPPETLVQEMLALLGPMAPPAASAQTADPVEGHAPAAVVAAPAKTPVIPNISGRSTSALPPRVKSIADLRKKAAEFTA